MEREAPGRLLAAGVGDRCVVMRRSRPHARATVLSVTQGQVEVCWIFCLLIKFFPFKISL